MICIYKIVSPKNKIYIGQTRNFSNRYAQYKTLNCKSQVKLYNSIKKWGFNTHFVYIIHVLPKDIPQEVLDIYEVFYWEQYKNCGFEMLNLKTPGKGGKHTEETKQKMRMLKLGKKQTQEHIDKCKASRAKNKRKPTTEKAKLNMSLAQTGRKHSEETKKLMSEKHKGLKQNEEWVKKRIAKAALTRKSKNQWIYE